MCLISFKKLPFLRVDHTVPKKQPLKILREPCFEAGWSTLIRPPINHLLDTTSRLFLKKSSQKLLVALWWRCCFSAGWRFFKKWSVCCNKTARHRPFSITAKKTGKARGSQVLAKIHSSTVKTQAIQDIYTKKAARAAISAVYRNRLRPLRRALEEKSARFERALRRKRRQSGIETCS